MLAIPENNTTTNMYNPEDIRKGSLNNKLVFMQNANADVTKSGKHTTITINCRCFECNSMSVRGTNSGGRAFESFADYYIHVSNVLKKDIEIFKCPCKGCPWSIVRAFGAMIKHLRLEHSELHEEFSTLCDGDFKKLWISVDENNWKAVLKFKKIIKSESPVPDKKEEQITWDDEPVLGAGKTEVNTTWTKPPKMETKSETVPSAEDFQTLSSLVEDSMKKMFIGPLENPSNVIIDGIEYYAARAPWDITLDENNKLFTGIMKKGTTFYVGMCINERPLTMDEKRSPENNHYCLDKTCSFDHMAGWSSSVKTVSNTETAATETISTETAATETAATATTVPVEENDSELEQICSELVEMVLPDSEIQQTSTHPQKRKAKRNEHKHENLSAFEGIPDN